MCNLNLNMRKYQKIQIEGHFRKHFIKLLLIFKSIEVIKVKESLTNCSKLKET